jgi:hypothetical protein
MVRIHLPPAASQQGTVLRITFIGSGPAEREWRIAAHPHALLLQRGDLVGDAFAGDLTGIDHAELEQL